VTSFTDIMRSFLSVPFSFEIPLLIIEIHCGMIVLWAFSVGAEFYFNVHSNSVPKPSNNARY